MFKSARQFLMFCIMGILFHAIALTDYTIACSRVFWNTNQQAAVVARTLDWDRPFGERLVIYPRGAQMHGGAGENSLTWVSKYGSIGIVPYGFALAVLKINPSKELNPLLDGNMEGINEKGLAAHLLFLHLTKYEKRDLQKPGVTYFRWLRYVLDNFETVKDAVDGMRNIQVVQVEIGGTMYPLHMAIEDSSGDSAIIEFVDGNMTVHHGREYTVMTNDPQYPLQLENLASYRPFGGTIEELPGGVNSKARFIRAATFLKTLPEPKNQTEAIAYLCGVIRNVSVPFGALSDLKTVAKSSPTWWTSVADLKERLFYFNCTSNPNVIWVNLSKIDFAAETPIKLLDPTHADLLGDVTGKFVPAPPAK